MLKLSKYLLVLVLASVTSLAAAAPYGYSINSDSPNDISDSLYRIDLATGTDTRIGRVSLPSEVQDVEGLAFSPDGTLYGIDEQSLTLFPLDPKTGHVLQGQAPVKDLPFSGNDFGMTFACDGTLYITSIAKGALYRMDLEGNTTPIGNEGSLGVPISAIAAFGDPVKIYGLGNGLIGDDKGQVSDGTPSLFEINVSDGTTTEIGPLGPAAGGYFQAGLAFDDDGQLWAITDRRFLEDVPSQVMKLDVSTGTASEVKSTSELGFESLAITVPRGCDIGNEPNAHFKVQKQFADGNKALPSTFSIACNGGLPREQSHTTKPGEGVEVSFTVSSFIDGELDCDIWETTSEDYKASYECFSTGDCTTSSSMCSFTNTSIGQDNLCVIRNYPEKVEVGVDIEWVVDAEGIQLVDDSVAVDLYCRNIMDGDGDRTIEGMHWSWVFDYEAPPEDQDPGVTVPVPGGVATVVPYFDGSSECRVEAEPTASAVGSSSNCENWQPVFTGAGTLTCIVTNTFFFEGVPTLNRGGIILASLLLLFTGLVFVRRF